MSTVNKVILVGNLGADPEVRYTQSGQPVASMSVATNEVWNDKDGQRQERTEWFSISVFGKQAEVCGRYLSKGRQVYVEGRLQSRQYTDKAGIERRAWEVVARDVVFLGSGESQGQQRGSRHTESRASDYRSSRPSAPSGGGADGRHDDSVLPF